MLHLKPFRQRTGFCGPSCIKMVLDYYGIDKKTEKQIALIAGASQYKGINGESLLKAAKKFGLMGFIKDFSEFKDIKYYVNKKKIPVIVDWFSEYTGHYSVVVHIDRENIYFMDPELGHIRAMRLSRFKSLWFDFDSEYLRSKDDLILRRMIVLVPNTFKLKNKINKTLLKA